MSAPSSCQASTGWWVRNDDTIVLFDVKGGSGRASSPEGLELEAGQPKTKQAVVPPKRQRYDDLPSPEQVLVDQEANRQFRAKTGITRRLDTKTDRALVIQRLRIRDQIAARKPLLSECCSYRRMQIANDPKRFIDDLVTWIGTCVTSRTIDPTTGQPYRREIELITKAFPDIQEIVQYAQREPGLGMGAYTVHAEYDWGLTNGTWFVRAVHFSIQGKLLPSEVEPPDPLFRSRPWKPGILARFPSDLEQGRSILNGLKHSLYEEAKKEASLPKNPISPPSVETLKDAAVKVVKTGELPAVGFAKVIVGDLLDVAANNMAGRVAQVRLRAYSLYIAGFVQVVAQLDFAPPTNPFDSKFYNLGRCAADALSDAQRYQVQLALLRYYSDNPPSEWSFPEPLNWKFPDDYKRNWSPERLGAAFFNQLFRAEYSVN